MPGLQGITTPAPGDNVETVEKVQESFLYFLLNHVWLGQWVGQRQVKPSITGGKLGSRRDFNMVELCLIGWLASSIRGCREFIQIIDVKICIIYFYLALNAG